VKPSVAISAVRAVRPCNRALVVTVIPLRKALHVLRLRAGAFEHERHGRQHGARLIGGRRGNLGGVDCTVVADEHGVGEGAADIDPEEHAREPTRRPPGLCGGELAILGFGEVLV